MLPTLDTPRLVLRPARASDLDAMWALWTDRDVRRFLWDDVSIPREQAAETLSGTIALHDDGLGMWMVVRREDSAVPIGCAALLPVSTAAEFDPSLAGAVEPLIARAPRAWHNGYAVEALAAAIAYGFGPRGLDRLVAVIDIPNEVSHRVIRRLGFTERGESDGPRYRMRSYELVPTGFAGRDREPQEV